MGGANHQAWESAVGTLPRVKTPDGGVAYDDGEILVIVTGLRRPSSNSKTGDLVQTWIIARNVAPTEAQRTGLDRLVCGDCPQRPALGGACYVTVAQAPLSVWRAYHAGRYPVLRAEHLRRAVARGAGLRIGSYGDPAAVPVAMWRALASYFRHVVGYTHQWRTNHELRSLTMASVDSAQEGAEARALGWRTFRVRKQGEPLVRGEIACPASEEAGYGRTCTTCGACDGAREGDRRASVAIIEHGARVRRLPVLG